MNVITKLATKLLATFSVVAMLSTPAAAQGLNTSDMALAFGQSPQTARSMSAAEMDETEGAALPLYIAGQIVAATGRFVIQQVVTRQAAVKAAQKGTDVLIKNGTRQDAKNIATQAFGKGNTLRHGPGDHKNGVDFSHFQPKQGAGGHVFYGNRFPRK